MIDQKRARLLQDIYNISKSNQVLGLLHQEITQIAQSILWLKIKKSGIKMDDIHQAAWDAATRFIEMYLKHEDWNCNSFTTRIDLEVKYYLYNPKKQKREKAEKYELDPNMQEYDKQEKEDTRWTLKDIKYSQPENYSFILYTAYTSLSYKSFIIRLSTKLSKRWMLDHAQRLKLLYKYTRRDK